MQQLPRKIREGLRIGAESATGDLAGVALEFSGVAFQKAFSVFMLPDLLDAEPP